MAQFYGEIRGNRGQASRLGGKENGFWAQIRGWKVGIELNLQYNEDKKRDEIAVFLTGGSNHVVKSKLLGVFTNRGRRLRQSGLVVRQKKLKIQRLKLGAPRVVEDEHVSKEWRP